MVSKDTFRWRTCNLFQECLLGCSHGLVKVVNNTLWQLHWALCGLNTKPLVSPVNSLNDAYALRLKRFLYSLKGCTRSLRDSFMVDTATWVTTALMLCPPPICRTKKNTGNEITSGRHQLVLKVFPVRFNFPAVLRSSCAHVYPNEGKFM